MAFTHLPLRRSAPVGILAYVVGYTLTLGATVGRISEVVAIEMSATVEHVASAPLGQIFGSTPPSWVVGGWFFYNAHFVPTSLPTADPMNGIRVLTNRSLLSTLGWPFVAIYLLPPLLLLAGGYFVAQTGNTSGVNGTRNGGASIVVGYLPVFLFGAFVFTANSATGGVVASPAGLPAVFLGLVYPVVFGALGGTLADWHGESASDTSETEVRTR